MVIRIILFVIGSVFVVFGLVGLFQSKELDCLNIKNVVFQNDCIDINNKIHYIFYSGLLGGLSMIIIALAISVKLSIQKHSRRISST